MRKLILELVIIFTIGIFNAHAQDPVIYNFEGVAYTPQGKTVVNADMLLRVWIKSTKPGGGVIYEETQNISTDANGVFNLHIGYGKIINGSMNSVGSGGNRYIKIEMASIGESTKGQIRFKCLKCRQSNERYMLHRVEAKS